MEGVPRTGVPLVTSTLGASLTIGRDWTSSPEMLPGPLSASPGWDRITDTGIRMSLVGDLALCTTQGFEILGLTCQFCKGISAVIRPWSKCGSCGAFLTRITESHRSPSVLRVDWDTGATTIYEEKPVTAVDFRTITAKQLSRIHARARGRALQHLGEVTHAPGGLSSAGTGETSGMGSDVSSGGDDSLSALGVTGTAARVPSAVSEQKEGETTGESGGWEYVREALPKADTASGVKLVTPPSMLPECSTTVSEPAVVRSSTERAKHKTKGPRMEVVHDGSQRDDSPPRTAARAYAENMAYCHYVKKAPNSYLKPGMGNAVTLPRFSRFQRLLNKRVAREYGYEYPFVPEHVMDYIEEQRHDWQESDVWDFLGVPKPFRDPKLSSVFADKFFSCMLQWSYGRYIYKDRVTVKRPDRSDVDHSYTVVDDDGIKVEYPDPMWY